MLRALEATEVEARLSATSFAGTRPITDNKSKDGRRANRRVELVISVDPDLIDAFEPTPPEDEEQAEQLDPSPWGKTP